MTEKSQSLTNIYSQHCEKLQRIRHYSMLLQDLSKEWTKNQESILFPTG